MAGELFKMMTGTHREYNDCAKHGVLIGRAANAARAMGFLQTQPRPWRGFSCELLSENHECTKSDGKP